MIAVCNVPIYVWLLVASVHLHLLHNTFFLDQVNTEVYETIELYITQLIILLHIISSIEIRMCATTGVPNCHKEVTQGMIENVLAHCCYFQ